MRGSHRHISAIPETRSYAAVTGLYFGDARGKPPTVSGTSRMLGTLNILPALIPATSGLHVFLTLWPATSAQTLASAALALMIIFGVACLRQWHSARRWTKVLDAYADRDIGRARRNQSPNRDQPVAPARNSPPPDRDTSNGPSPL